MPPRPVPEADLQLCREAVERNGGNVSAAARELNIASQTLASRLDMGKRREASWIAKIKGREHVEVSPNSVVLIASDGHYWPGPASTAHRAFVKFCKKLKPALVIYNGDVLDAPTISRHPPIGWDRCPTLADELETCEERLNEIVKAAGKAKRYWPLGNHDGRFETRLAQAASEFKGVKGLSLSDRFPLWEPCWSVWINDDVVVKHRYKGGIHSAHNNTLYAGKTIVTGHDHRLLVSPFEDYQGRRWGIKSGTLADPFHEAFQDYTEDNPRLWTSGFVVLQFAGGKLMWPELVPVTGPNTVEFRGEIIEV